MQNLRTVINPNPYSHFGASSIKCTKSKKLPLKSDTITYLFSFNGQERDDEVAGVGNITTAEFWEYDARMGRRWNCDPKPNHSFSPYSCFANNPICFSDPYGDTLFSKGNSKQNQTDLANMCAETNRGRITIATIAARTVTGGDPSFANYVKLNTDGYEAGSDPAFDLLISLSGTNVDAIYSSEPRPLVTPTSGFMRTTPNQFSTVRVGYNDFSGVIINSSIQKQGISGDLSTFGNGEMPPSKPITGGAIPIVSSIAFQVAINPEIQYFRGSNPRYKDRPRSMVAFQMLQSCVLLINNSTNINYTLNQAVIDANRVIGSSSYQGVRPKLLPLMVPNVKNK